MSAKLASALHWSLTLALLLFLLWYAFLFRRAMQWNLDLQHRIDNLETEVRVLKKSTSP